MILLIGTRSTLRLTENISDKCPHCDAKGSLSVNVFQRYACCFWIPVFPDRKFWLAVCGNCSQTFKPEQVPITLMTTCEKIKSKATTPIWNFTGVFLAILGVVAAFVYSNQNDKKIVEYLKSPKTGDVLQMALKDDVYTLYKVQRISKDSVYVFANKYQTNEASGIGDLEDKEYDQQKVYGFSKSELIEMSKHGKILDIDRK